MTQLLELPQGKRVWFSADHHFNHKNIIRFAGRPHTSLWHMNSDMVRRHNAVVAPDEVFMQCGDLALGDFEEALEFASQLNGIKYIKPGNHERVSVAMRQRPGSFERFTAMYEAAGFTVLPEVGATTIELDGQLFDVSHYPHVGDHTERDRHVALRPEDTGRPLIHGHIHTLRKTSGRMFNVGVDVNDFTPVSSDEILAWAATLA